MKKILKVLRRESPQAQPHYELFTYETEDEGATVATALMQIGQNSDLTWEHSCLQKKCGACAMVIDGRPALACDTRLSDCKNETVLVEPLRKFPMIRDLLVDRGAVAERLKAMKAYPVSIRTQTGDESPRQVRQAQKDDETAYEASRCIQCGLCLEVCPNYYKEGVFSGMAAMAPMARLLAKDDNGANKAVYRKYVYEGCGKSLACRDICPAGIDMDKLLSRSNGEAFRWGKRK